jgi:hypothetical protein
MRPATLALLVGAALLVLLARLPWGARPAAARPPAARLPEATALPLRTAPAEAERAVQGGEAARAVPDPAAVAELDDAGLRAALAHLATVLDQGGPELEAALVPLLADPRTAQRVLTLLVTGELVVDPRELSAEELGAVAALFYAFEIYNAPEADLAWMVAGVDGRAFGGELLAALPDIRELARGMLVERLAQASVEGRFILDGTWRHAILALRRAHPELRELFSSLLENMGTGLADEERQAFYALFLTESDDPTLIKVALAQLLTGERPETFLAWAGELWAQPGATPELREGIAQAVAAAAPADLAASFLGGHADEGLFAAFHALGARADGGEALAHEYDHLVASDLSPAARRMLISGMSTAGESQLLGIARTDPDANARGQALVTLTAFPRELTQESVAALRTAYGERDDPQLGVPVEWTTLAAANLVRAGIDTGLRTRALDLLREMAEDPGLAAGHRRQALEQLGPWLEPEVRAAIEAAIP